MVTLSFEFTVFVLIYVTDITISETIEIIRPRDGTNGWQNGKDSFKIPHSLFDQDGIHYINCSRFNAEDISDSTSHYHCSCPRDSATLIFGNNEWKCLKNSETRSVLETDIQNHLFFKTENNDSELRMLNFKEKRQVSLNTKKWGNCTVNESLSWSTGCDGIKAVLKNSPFSIVKKQLRVEKNVSDADLVSGRIINLSIRCTSKENTDTWKRLLFKFEGTINCSISLPTSQPSVPTKSLGVRATLTILTGDTKTALPLTPKLTTAAAAAAAAAASSITTTPENLKTTIQTSALASLPTISSANPTGFDTSQTFTDSSPIVYSSLKTSTNTPPSTSLYTPSKVSTAPPTVSEMTPVTPPSVLVAPSSISFPQPAISEISPFASLPSPTTQAKAILPTTFALSKSSAKPSFSRERVANNSQASLVLISSVVSGFLLIVISIFVFLFYRRCHSNKHRSGNPSEKSQVSIMMNTQTNPGYEPDDQNLYKTLNFSEPPIYASHYKVPHQAHVDDTQDIKENKTDEVDVEMDHYAPLNIPEGRNIYGLGNDLDRDDKIYKNYNSISIEQPVYNILEEISVLEGSGESLDEKTEPVYNVLEGPHADDFDDGHYYGTISSEEPVYTALERPCQNGADDPFNDSEQTNEPIYNVLDEGDYVTLAGEGNVCYDDRGLQDLRLA